MAVFKDKNDKKIDKTAIISQGVKINGDLDLKAKLHVEGEIEGKIDSITEISIGKDGKIKGELKAKKLIINGKFEGVAECDEIEILNGGELKGNITIKNFIIESGGIFIGTSALKTTQN